MFRFFRYVYHAGEGQKNLESLHKGREEPFFSEIVCLYGYMYVHKYIDKSIAVESPPQSPDGVFEVPPCFCVREPGEFRVSRLAPLPAPSSNPNPLSLPEAGPAEWVMRPEAGCPLE